MIPVESRRAMATMAVVILLYGLALPLAKLVTAPSLLSAAARLGFAVPVLVVATAVSGSPVTVEALRRTALPGCLMGFNLVLMFFALSHVSVAVMAVVQAMQPGAVLLVAWVWFGERVSRRQRWATAAAIAGVVVVIAGRNPSIRVDAVGIGAAIVSMVTFTAFFMSNRVARAGGMNPLLWLAGASIAGATVVTPVALVATRGPGYGQVGVGDVLLLALQAAMITVLGHALMSWAHRFLPASRSALYLLGLNVVAIAAAWPLLDEPVTPLQSLGALIVIGALALVIAEPGPVPPLPAVVAPASVATEGVRQKMPSSVPPSTTSEAPLT